MLTGRTAADSAAMKGIETSMDTQLIDSGMKNLTAVMPQNLTGQNWSIGLETGMSTARSALESNAFGGTITPFV